MLGWSLRSKLIAACVVVELVATVLVLTGGDRLMQRMLREQATVQAQEAIALLDQTLAMPLAQRDYATVQQTLDLLRNPGALNYLVLFDHRERLIASSGWDSTRPLPPRDRGDVDMDRADATLHLAAPIVVSGQQIARLDLGLSTERLREARDEFRHNGLLIAALAMVLSIGLMALIAFAITRHLAKLVSASQRIAAGDYNIHVPVEAQDEIGRLGASFNAMAATIRDRMLALQESEQRQRVNFVSARDEQIRLSSLLGALRSGILFVDDDQRVVYSNAAFVQIWSLVRLEPGQPMAEIVPLLASQTVPEDAVHLAEMLGAKDNLELAGRDIHTVDGRLISQRVQCVSAGVGGAGGRIWLHQDITLDRETQERARQAVRDPLTDLFNRRGLYDMLQEAILHAARAGSTLALIFIDLDDFKHANDVAGHRVGDEILVAVARALSAQLRQGEIVARLGGDEFAVLSPDITAEEGGAIAQRLVQAVSSLKFTTEAQPLRVGCSIGLALFPADAQTADDLIACADTAMYQAKQEGKNDWCLYRSDPARSHSEATRVSWNERINRALRNQLLTLHFQPVHRAADLSIVYHEALVRMVDEHDPSRLIEPAEFVPHAERSGKIRQIDRWVFESCIEQLANTDASVCIAANLSARSLEDASFVDFLRDALKRGKVDPRRLHVELTETAAIGDLAAAGPMIASLRNVGCSVHLDDFGSGFSSFSHLRLLEVDAIKIDGSFIRDLTSNASNQLVVASLIKIAHNLDKTTVAECVEDASTLDLLRQLGIDHVQGHHLGHPSARLAGHRSTDGLLVG